MTAMSQILRHGWDNAFARMLTMTRKSVTKPCESLSNRALEDIRIYNISSPKHLLDEWAPPLDAYAKTDHVARNRRRTGILFFRDWETDSDE